MLLDDLDPLDEELAFEAFVDLESLPALALRLPELPLRSSRSVGERPPLVLPNEDVFEPRELEALIELDLVLLETPPPPLERRSEGESSPQPGFA